MHTPGEASLFSTVPTRGVGPGAARVRELAAEAETVHLPKKAVTPEEVRAPPRGEWVG